MTYLLIGLVVLVAFLFGMASFALVLYQRLFKHMLSGRPAFLTLPGNRPGKQVMYAITAQGWRRLTPKGPSKKARRRARRQAKQAAARMKANVRTPIQKIAEANQPVDTE